MRIAIRIASWYCCGMASTQVPTRFDETELAELDELVASGAAETRSELIRAAVHQMHEIHRRRAVGALIAAAYRLQPQGSMDDEWAMANANALTEAEPW
jgi:Arc/MetJ-type ribon-helix-helix transcriptional regulator